MKNDLLLDTDSSVNVGRGHVSAVEQVSAMMAAGPVYICAVTVSKRQCKALFNDQRFAAQAILRYSPSPFLKLTN